MEEAGGGANLPGTVGRPPGTSRQAYRFRLLGRVQGVGFRPFVVRLAVRLGLAGWVKNTPDGVVIHLEGAGERLAEFRDRLERELPPAAEIHAITVEEEPGENCRVHDSAQRAARGVARTRDGTADSRADHTRPGGLPGMPW